MRQRGSWPNDRHISPEHIEELRKLVYSRLSQYPSHTSHPRVVGNFKNWTILLVALPQAPCLQISALNHGTKLVHLELATALAYANLSKENRRLRVIQFDRNGNK